MTIKQTPLPYELNALEPHISAETMSYHYDRHYRGYIRQLNDLIDGTSYAGKELEDIIIEARSRADLDILNNAMQAWNHAFLWECMSPNGEAKPEGQIQERIQDDFGGYKAFAKEFRDTASSLFGSGWVWLVDDHGKLKIVSTGNADSPVGTHLTPLLVLDVWEHAYYIDYRNDRKAYIDTFLSKLINWKFAGANLDAARQSELVQKVQAA
jgi:superoxide dismutase, Fe-Mn family